MSMVKCKICNADIKPNDKFCSECGAVIADQTVPESQIQQPSYSQPQIEEQQTTQQPKKADPIPTPAAPAYTGSASTEAASNLTKGRKTKDNTQLGVFGYVITMLALAVPILGLILVFVWAFGNNTNLARKNYCRALLVVTGIFLVLGITGLILNYNALMQFISVMGR